MRRWSLLLALSFTSVILACQNSLNAPSALNIGKKVWSIKSHISTGDETLLASNWHLQEIHWRSPERELAKTYTPKVVAVLDTGLDPSYQQQHPDVFYPNLDFIGEDSPYNSKDGHGHGTHIAGIIHQISQGYPVRVLPVKVIPQTGHGIDQTLIQALDQLLNWEDKGLKVSVVNLSLSSPYVSAPLEVLIKKGMSQGVLFIAAAGNEPKEIAFPASIPGVLTVGASGPEAKRTDYSAFGKTLEILAPGGEDAYPIASTWPRYLTFADKENKITESHLVGWLTGTSMAAPMVAATAAVIWSKHPELNAKQVRQRLLIATEPIKGATRDEKNGYGFLNFSRAVDD
jgi:subtilisin family serine protease